MKRVLLFIATNFAIVLVLSLSMRLLGVEPYLNAQGLNLTALLIFAAVMGFGGAFISLALSKFMAKRSMGVVIVTTATNQTEQWLLNTVQRFSIQAGIKMPEVGIFASPEPNAFATGMSKNNALVAVSTGLLEQMTQDEVEAVIGHEIAHIANGDMITLTLIQGVVNTFVMFFARIIGYFVDKVILRSESNNGPGFFISVIVAELVLGLLASIIVMWFSRQREFRADAGGAKLAGRGKMIAALERLNSLHSSPMPATLAAFGISGATAQGIKRLFLTHPPLTDRIAALRHPNAGELV